MEIFTFTPKDRFGANMYILKSDNDYAVIDPSVSYNELNNFLPTAFALKYILITHVHFDHILALESWKSDNKAANVLVGKNDVAALKDSNLNCYKQFTGRDIKYVGDYIAIGEEDNINFGNTNIRVIDTPGHTPGSISFLIQNNIFVGDLVFCDGSIGRCDLPGGSINTIRGSLKKVLNLPDCTAVYSGHGEATTIQKIKNELRRQQNGRN